MNDASQSIAVPWLFSVAMWLLGCSVWLPGHCQVVAYWSESKEPKSTLNTRNGLKEEFTHFLVPIDFHSIFYSHTMEVNGNCLVTNILQNTLFGVQQKKEIYFRRMLLTKPILDTSGYQNSSKFLLWWLVGK